MPTHPSPFLVEDYILWAVAFSMSSIAGLAWLLRSTSKVNFRTATSSLLNSGVIGVAVAIVSREYGGCTTQACLGFSLMAGIGGVTFVELAARSIYVLFRKTLESRYGVGDDLRHAHEKDGHEILEDEKRESPPSAKVEEADLDNQLREDNLP